MTAAEAIAYASRLRQRLRNPPNAVRDTDIDLGRQSAAARAALDELRLRERTDASYKVPPRVAPRFWTDERCAKLTDLWQTGAKAQEIAKSIGATSRRAVIAKAHVLGLPPRNKPRKRVKPPLFDMSRATSGDGRGAITTIQEIVASAYGLSRNTLISHRRGKLVIGPRHVAMYLCTELTTASLPMIGRMFAGRDHTTIMHASDKIARMRKTDQKLNSEIVALIVKLRLVMEAGA